MSDIAIRVESLGKRYRIGERERYYALRDVPGRMVSAALRPFRRSAKAEQPDGQHRSDLWALKDVSFEVKQGEVVGVIGRNGAGKSTLLKILSRITDPTVGEVRLRGRVGSLLEVGTGFHPELTGRENIYLNGSILGMRKAEIARRFEAIVHFAEVETFIDTPVKHYSSGMQVRLAFAVAAHLNPEVLLVDEVLAVGDAAFQSKCLGQMSDATKGHRTTLFVSHQLNQIRTLCGRCIYLRSGNADVFDTAAEAIAHYESDLSSNPVPSTSPSRSMTEFHRTRFLGWALHEPSDSQPNVLRTFGPVAIAVFIDLISPIRNGRYVIHLRDRDGVILWGDSHSITRLTPGSYQFICSLASLPLKPGTYWWDVGLFGGDEWIERTVILPELIIDTNPVAHFDEGYAGLLNIPSSFEAQSVPS